MSGIRTAAAAAIVALGMPRESLAAQTTPAPSRALSLAAALQEAECAAFPNRIVTASAAVDRARAGLPLKGILPSARVEAGAIRTTDPIGAFGTLLRQRLVTSATFDPAHLNQVRPISNVQGGLVVEVPIMNADTWLGRRAALAAASATAASGEWTAIAVRADVIRAWYGAVLASAQMRTLIEAQCAVDAGVRQVPPMVQQGQYNQRRCRKRRSSGMVSGR